MAALGHDVTHTLDLLPLGNRTPDGDIAKLAANENRVVVTKDSDFVTSFVLRHVPPKLLLVATGNISNEVLFRLITANLTTLVNALANYDFVELSATAIIIHS